MDQHEIVETAKTVAVTLMEELKSGTRKVVGGEVIEQACDAALQLHGRDRELLIDTATRRFVELTAW